MSLTSEQIAAARELCAKATPGPWYHHPLLCHRMIGTRHGVCRYPIHANPDIEAASFPFIEASGQNDAADVAFIAASRTLLPVALDEVERLRQRFDLELHLHRQRAFSEQTFGPGTRTKGLIDHIRKELAEIEDDPTDIMEWVDVIILAFDGAWRAGWEPEEIIKAIVDKQTKNEGRTWPDWRTQSPDKAIEHIGSIRSALAEPTPCGDHQDCGTCINREDCGEPAAEMEGQL